MIFLIKCIEVPIIRVVFQHIIINKAFCILYEENKFYTTAQ